MDYLKLTGKPAIVTGAGRGIGRSIAHALAAYGAKVILCDVNDNDGLNAQKQIEAAGGIASYCHCDITNTADIKKMVDLTVNTFGGVDILVNNAGIGSEPIPFWNISDEEWNRMMLVDLAGDFYVSREVLPYMKSKNYGKIINISSGSGVIGCEYCSHYAAAKAGLIGFTQSIAKEVAQYKINVNAIAVPTTQTPMLAETKFDVFVDDVLKDIPWGRIGTPEDIANMVLYLASDASEMVVLKPLKLL